MFYILSSMLPLFYIVKITGDNSEIIGWYDIIQIMYSIKLTICYLLLHVDSDWILIYKKIASI